MTALVAVSLVFWLLYSILEVSLRSTAMWTGSLLLVLVVALAMFNVRKKLAFLPLGSAALWLQIHSYAGLFSVLVFLAHVGLEVPQGALELGLAFLFVAVAGSGIVGLAVTRLIPPRLTSHGTEVLLERIPVLRVKVQKQVESIVLELAREVQTTTISDFYREHLAAFLSGPRNRGYHLLGFAGAARQLETNIEALDRYLNDREREAVAEIRECVQTKDDLDFQEANQKLLKYWLFLHIPLTYSMLILVLIHVLLVLGFDGGIR